MVVMGLPGELFLTYQLSAQTVNMNQAIENIHFMSQFTPTAVNQRTNTNLLKKINHAKACPNRTGNGFCTRSNRPCPARLITVTFNH